VGEAQWPGGALDDQATAHHPRQPLAAARGAV